MISSIYKAFIINCIPMTPSSPFLISFLNFIHKFHTLKTRLILSLQPFLSQPALLVSSFLVNASPNSFTFAFQNPRVIFDSFLHLLPNLSPSLVDSISLVFLQSLGSIILSMFLSFLAYIPSTSHFPTPSFTLPYKRIFLYKWIAEEALFTYYYKKIPKMCY